MSLKKLAILLSAMVGAIAASEIRQQWSLAPIKTYSIVPIALSNNDRSIAELYPNATFNDADSNAAHLLVNLTSYSIDGQLLGSCHVPLLGSHEYLAIRKIILTSVADDSEVIIWFVGSLKTDAVSMGVSVVDKSNCKILACTKLSFTGNPDNGHPDFPNFESVRVVANDDDGFKLILPAKYLCNGDLCAVEYEKSTRQFSEVTSLLDDVSFEEQWKMPPIAHDPTSKVYFVALRGESGLKVISNNGKQTELLQLPKSSLEAYSAFSRLFSYCGALGYRVNCLQLDSELRIKLNVTVRLASEPMTIAVLSAELSDDASLLLITTNADRLATVARIDDKQQEGNDELLKIKIGCNDALDFHVYREADGQTCLQYFCKTRADDANEFYDNVMHVACF